MSDSPGIASDAKGDHHRKDPKNQNKRTTPEGLIILWDSPQASSVDDNPRESTATHFE
ncbi:hypothetical protein SAMD00023353_1300570 [Rosellinia necatrix]|uniref:Uncharacterized protein n=1 Tax=Rosellinia necatrix TaxID=77044 RepID=A0A1S8A7S3_ROSNE|nr:hypothetical protein SAMD00023353_1300570 [Rosellinia necatrix]